VAGQIGGRRCPWGAPSQQLHGSGGAGACTVMAGNIAQTQQARWDKEYACRKERGGKGHCGMGLS
jgi:hypothetical protein